MKKTATVGSFLLGIGALVASGASFRPPAVPLAVNDPYLSLWSPADNLTDAETMHWSRDAQPLSILGEVRGKVWRFCGRTPADVPAARQVSLRVGCTETVYSFDAGGAPVEIRFSTPVVPGDWNVFSRPVTYLTVKGAKAKVSISPAFATDDDSAEMVTNRQTVAGCPALSIGRKVQPKAATGDRVRANTGWAWLVDAGDHFLLAYDSVSYIRFLGGEAPDWWRRLKRPFETHFTGMLADAYGIPLDNRKRWCKVDWLFWCATLAENRSDFEAMIAPTWKFLNETPDRVAFPDLYYTENAMCTRYGKEPDRFIGFNARPVIGGVYLPLVGAAVLTKAEL